MLGLGTAWGRRKEEPRRNRHKTTGPPPEANRHRPVGRDMEMTAQARGWEQRILPAATEATNGAWLVKKGCFEAMRLEAHRFGRPT